MSPLKLTDGTVLSSSCWLTRRDESMKNTLECLVVPSLLLFTWSVVCVWCVCERGRDWVCE